MDETQFVNGLAIPDTHKRVVTKILEALRREDLHLELALEDGELYVEIEDQMRGNLTEMARDLAEVSEAEQDEAISSVLHQVVAYRTEAELFLDEGEEIPVPELSAVVATLLPTIEEGEEFSYAKDLGGDVHAYLLTDTGSGWKLLDDQLVLGMNVADSKLWDSAVAATSQFPVSEVIEVEDDIVAILGSSREFSARALDMVELLDEAQVEYGDEGVFFAIPSPRSVLVLPVRAGSVEADAMRMVEYKNGLLENPDFVDAEGILGDRAYYWSARSEEGTGIICYEHEYTQNGEEYVELVLPDNLWELDSNKRD
ncbi:hypothetical protein [Boudabousia marimammalium]|uniref:Uncharacterized protein n=1 Tax=Boudabousia marimammalium TaxID=156892 RepID=A0A1Q5PQM4_9ACTO|nr:hypothetical protein [Boudabousia marimammalium]OKL49921.1 hypothetical protein BM477_03170 [Boudabousia marimammalium]